MGAERNNSTTTDTAAGTRPYPLERITVTEPSSLARTVGGTAIGNFTEWYDFGIYSYLVATISQVFFPASGELAFIATFAGLAVSFLVRPIGGIFWGLMGDRLGRRGVLALTVLLMAAGTTILGVLPGYDTIGIAAPILLFMSRALQGFSTGGEYTGAMTFLAEHSPDRHRGHLCSFLPVGTLSGYILGAAFVTILQAVLPHAAMLSWGWRIPLLLAFPLGLAGLYLRLRIEETPDYEQQEQSEAMSNKSGWEQIRYTLANHWHAILVCGGLTMAFNVTNYMLTGYLPTYFTEKLNVPDTPALIIVMLAMFVIVLLVIMFGKLGDVIGRKPILFAGCIALILVSVPMFLLTIYGGRINNNIVVFFGTLPQALMLMCFMSTIPSTLPALFPTNVRYGATSIGFNIAVSAFGGTTPLIAAALVDATGDLMMPAYILIVAGIIGTISVYFATETAGRPLRGSPPTAESEEEAREIAYDTND